MTKKLLTLTITIPLLLLLFTITNRRHLVGTAQAIGDLTVDWGPGILEGQPIFTVSNMAPGQTETRTVTVANGASSSRPLGIRGIEVSDTGNLSDVLLLEIKENGVSLYLNSLSQFFLDTVNPDTGIPFSTLASGASATYEFIVTFDPDAGDQFQDQSVVFDLKIGIFVELPEACQNIQFTQPPIFGTQNRDRLHGGNGRQLIVSFEGNDVISGGNAGDCILSGPGNDKVSGGNGPDAIDSGPGDDQITGGNGNDIVMAGPGADRIEGGNGHDQVFGQEGNDILKGGNGNDTLDGGPDTDSADGQLGTDTCDAETEIRCEL